ncbi:MAG: hypothetical protein ACLGGV_01750 [Bacteroidia bacterium]
MSAGATKYFKKHSFRIGLGYGTGLIPSLFIQTKELSREVESYVSGSKLSALNFSAISLSTHQPWQSW